MGRVSDEKNQREGEGGRVMAGHCLDGAEFAFGCSKQYSEVRDNWNKLNVFVYRNLNVITAIENQLFLALFVCF